MSSRRNLPLRLIRSAQLLIGAMVILGLAAFMTLDPYLIALFALAQPLIVLGVALFTVALLKRSTEIASQAAVSEERESITSIKENGVVPAAVSAAMIPSRVIAHGPLNWIKSLWSDEYASLRRAARDSEHSPVPKP
jgi:hypothetical protein